MLTQATNGPSKVITASDMLAQWEDLMSSGHRRCESTGSTVIQHQQQNATTTLSVTEPKTPTEIGGGLGRRSQSLLDIAEALQRCEKSLPATINEADTSSGLLTIGEGGGECSKENSKRRIPLDCEILSTVQAYTLLNAQANVQDIHS